MYLSWWIHRPDLWRLDDRICLCCPIMCLCVLSSMWFVLVCIQWCPSHIVFCFYFICFLFVLCTICCQFLWIVLLWLPLWHSLAFIDPYNVGKYGRFQRSNQKPYIKEAHTIQWLKGKTKVKPLQTWSRKWATRTAYDTRGELLCLWWISRSCFH